MTQKHYNRIAAILQAELTACQGPRERARVHSIIEEMAEYLAEMNPNFQRQKFLDAAKGLYHVST